MPGPYYYSEEAGVHNGVLDGRGGDEDDGYDEGGAYDEGGGGDELSRMVAAILMGAEELRRRQAMFSPSSISGPQSPAHPRPVTQDVVRWRLDLERLFESLERLRQTFVVVVVSDEPDPPPSSDIAQDMWRSCHRRVLDAAESTYQAALAMREPGLGGSPAEIEGSAPEADDAIPLDVLQQDGQAAVARILELLLSLHAAVKRHRLWMPAPQGQDGGPDVTSANPSDESAERAIAAYVQYQRQVYRQRAKACVADLVQARKRHQQLLQDWDQFRRAGASVTAETALRILAVDEDDEDQDHGGAISGRGGTNGPSVTAFDTPAAPVAAAIHHAAAIANLLGMAAQLIHPLLSWRNQLDWMLQQPDNGPDRGGGEVGPGQLRSVCGSASRVVHEQATALVETAASWMADDHRIDEWMETSASGSALGGVDGRSHNSTSHALQGLDGLVEELAYSCHVVRRYLVLVQDLLMAEGSGTSGTASQGAKPAAPCPLETLLHEWTWKYASLERHLAVQNWHAALEVAQPTTLVLGTSVRVPSFVEDAHYLSLRALKRAAGTAQSALAVGTVAHALSHDVWSTEDPVPPHSVHDALTNRHGCDLATFTHPNNESKASKPPRSGDFASAFLDALDQDVNRDASTSPSSQRRRQPTAQHGGSAPASGNFLSLIGLDLSDDEATHRRRLDVEFCALNGIHAAGTACRELVAFLDSLLSPQEDASDPSNGHDGPPLLETDAKSLAMIQLAREELFRSSQSYDELLAHEAKELVQLNSQSLVVLRDFFRDEDYVQAPSTMGAAEADDRLERDMMCPLKSSALLRQLSIKLDADVCRRVGDEIVHVLVEKVILQVLWTDGRDEVRRGGSSDLVDPKRFTELGALLLSKQVRMLQGFLARVVANPDMGAASVPTTMIGSTCAASVLPNFAQWERLSQVLTALQLEKPSDWLSYRYHVSSTLSLDELRKTMLLRADFSREAVSAVVGQVASASSAAAAT